MQGGGLAVARNYLAHMLFSYIIGNRIQHGIDTENLKNRAIALGQAPLPAGSK